MVDFLLDLVLTHAPHVGSYGVVDLMLDLVLTHALVSSATPVSVVVPHGRVRPSNQESTFRTHLTEGLVVKIWLCNTLGLRGDETLVLHH